MSRHLHVVSRHSRWIPNLSSPQHLRLAALVLMLITVNQIDEPLVEATYGEAALYWVLRPVVLACGLWLAHWLVSKYLAGRLTKPELLKPVVLVSAIGLVPLAITELLLETHLPFRPEFLDDDLWAFSPPLAFLGEFATLASIVIPIHLLLWLIIDKNAYLTGAAPSVAAETPAQPRFLQQATNFGAADVLALQAHEHYVRIFTREGAELIHYRFGDAAEEMPSALGLQVHRSWWVAESAVRSAQRGSRRWQLNLVTGDAVPVSDSYVSAVRERGWLKRRSKR